MEEKMTENYEPDSQFLERLEWQLSSEFRRTNRLKSSPGNIAIPRRIVAVACMMGMLMTGVAIVKAADYLKDSWRKKIEIARAETQVQLKTAHLEFIREMAARAEKQSSDGVIREEEYQAMKISAEKADLDLKKSQLNLDEVRVSGVIPRGELYAPKVGGRDFVTERLKIEKDSVELDLDMLRRHWERLERLVEEDLVSEHEMAPVQAEIAVLEVTIDKIQKQLDLRERFIAREISALEVEIKDLTTAAEKNMRQAQSRVDSLNTQLKRLKNLERRGMISPSEIKQLENVLFAAETELKLATLEMDVLEKVK
jgi:multidrug resistance efflux pump